MTPRQLTFEDCEAVSDLETRLFDGRFDTAGLRELLGKPAFYGAVSFSFTHLRAPATEAALVCRLLFEKKK